MSLSGSRTALAALALLVGLLLFPEQGRAQNAPTISGPNSLSFPENTATTLVLAIYTAIDADMDPLTPSLTGNDAGAFTLTENSGGSYELKFMEAPDFEFPGDEGGNNVYTVTVNVEDDDGMSAMLPVIVTVTVTNEDEPGTVTITGTLSGGEQLTAAVTDIDGAVSGLTWQWARGDSDSGPFSDIGTETSDNSYTSVAADVDKYLQATASYTDPEGSGKTATAVTGQIGAGNSEPEFSAETATRTLLENSSAGVNVVGGTTAATDSGDTLTYTLTGTDAGSFEIDSNGQLKTRTGVSHNFNFEATKNSYSVTVSVHDGKDTAGNTDATIDATITVTINLTNVNEAPEITGGAANLDIPENTDTSTFIETYVASDPDASTTFTWSLEGVDAGNFTITRVSNDGRIFFKNVPNYEMPADTGGNNVYNVTVKVTDGRDLSDTRDIAVTVTNVNEAPTITSGPTTMNVAENSTAVGAYTASDVDLPTTLTWSVEPADDGSFFEIDPSSGELSFINAPDFEDKQDADGDNAYDVTVKVTDSGSPAMSATRDVAVTVTNVNEGAGVR